MNEWDAVWDQELWCWVNPWTGEIYDPDIDNGAHLPLLSDLSADDFDDIFGP